MVDEILVPKDDDTSLGDIQRQLGFGMLVELVQLDARDFCPELWGQVVDVGAVEEASWVWVVERGVARVDVLERDERGELVPWVPGREELCVLVVRSRSADGSFRLGIRAVEVESGRGALEASSDLGNGSHGGVGDE